jgi:ectoine hydroxylase-related dioxygenase (phytanoyl-CoA dioxygenase family)
VLTDQQIRHFEVFGFIILRNLLTSEEIAAARKEHDEGLERARATTQSRGIRKQFNWTNLGPESPFLGSLLEDVRFLNRAEQLLDGEVIGQYANSNVFSSDRTEWHPDTRDLSRRGLKFAFYLEPLDQQTGALRFIPGSHKAPFHTDIGKISLKESNNGVIDPNGFEIDEMPSFIAKSEPGDVVAFDGRVWHASWGGRTNRRMCSVGYFAAPTSTEEEDCVRRIAEGEVGLVEAFPLIRRPDYWITNADGNPIRTKWITQLRIFGFLGL